MKTNPYKSRLTNTPLHTFIATAAVAVLLVLFTACPHEPIVPTPPDPQPIDYTPEVNDPVTNDFTMVKACIGETSSAAATILGQRDFLSDGEKYTHTENGITKIVSLYPTNGTNIKQGELYVRDQEMSVMLPIFKQWMQEFRASTPFTKLVRSSYSISENGNAQNFNNYEDFLAAVENIPSSSNANLHFMGNDIYANEYEIYISNGYTKWMELRILNSRIGQPSNDFTQSDLQDSDLHKNILISKVDYLTFRYKGFYALNVQNPVQSGTEIPFLAQYQSPGDFGWIKLYYQNTNNLLMSGGIVWMGCGHLDFPTGFRAGLSANSSLPYPGQGKIAYIDNSGNYQTVSDESDLQHVWQTVSKQQEFRHYYANSHKKVAVYLYTPSVGMGNPADWYYLVFVEQ